VLSLLLSADGNTVVAKQSDGTVQTF
jgi:hypothetical protein